MGAALILTKASVTEPTFWRIAERGGATRLAGVPHTFALLDRTGFAGDALPDLHLMTCAGGPLPSTTARRFADLGARNG